jgi:hypothetical protein
MKITLDNYEVYFLDYIEGRLSAEEMGELSLFLALNPEMKAQFDGFETLVLKPDKTEFNNKQLLKKFEFDTTPINNNNFNDFCIAYYDGLLDEKKASELLSFCSNNSQKNDDFKRFKDVYLKLDVNTKFNEKNRLYKKIPVKRSIILTRVIPIAASIAIILTILVYQGQKQIPNEFQPAAITTLPVEKSNQSEKPIAKQTNRPPIVRHLNKFNKVAEIHSPQATQDQMAQSVINKTRETEEKLAMLQPKDLKPITESGKSILKVYLSEEDNSTEIASNSNMLLASAERFLGKIKSDVKNINEIKGASEKISFFKICQAGIKGINYLTDSNMTLSEKNDEKSNVTTYSFESGLLKFQQKRSN